MARGERAVDLGRCPDCGGPLEKRRQPFTILEVWGIAAVLAIMAATAFTHFPRTDRRVLTVCVQFPTLLLMLWGLGSAHSERVGLLCRSCGKFRLPPGVRPQDRPGPWPVLVAAGFLSLIYFFGLMAGSTHEAGLPEKAAGVAVCALVLLYPVLHLAFRRTARRVWSSGAAPPEAGSPLSAPTEDDRGEPEPEGEGGGDRPPGA